MTKEPSASSVHSTRPDSQLSSTAADAIHDVPRSRKRQSSVNGSPSSPAPAKRMPADLTAPADTSMANARAASSQSVASTNPPSTTASDGNGEAAGSSTASPYGTRSRRRTGGARPNYAEDREGDLEFEYTNHTKDDDSQKTTRASAAASAATNLPSEPSSRGVGSSRRAPAVSLDSPVPTPPSNTTTAAPAAKEIPGTSTFTVTATTMPAQQSKKRKAGAGHNSQATKGGTAAKDTTPLGETNMFSFEDSGARLQNGTLIADDGTVLAVNDNVYLVCEPPGEPYYLGRIMEFLHVGNNTKNPVDALRINWYYRPKDIGRKVHDTRQVFASMHSDISPLTALRGKCSIQHKSDVENIDNLRKVKDAFWYEKLYDRYMLRYYEVIPTKQIVNVPAKVKAVLHERWSYILVEQGRGKELTAAVKSCKRCGGYCASHDSVDCAVCQNTYHMNCVRPPLLKKPSRGFAWACGPCSRAQERKLEARNTPNVADAADDEDLYDEDEDDGLACPDTGATTPSRLDSIEIHPATAEQLHQASLWPYRYLGIHCKVEDALDYDDRIYPRASSRLGPRHQANVSPWYGRPVELVKPLEVRRRYYRGRGGYHGAPKLTKEQQAQLELDKAAREKRPKWVMDAPVGYIPRGDDHENEDPECTAYLQFRLPEVGEMSIDPSRGGDDNEREFQDPAEREKLIDQYMERAKDFADQIGVPDFAVNFLDKALSLLVDNKYDVEAALEQLATVDKKALKEPELTPTELKKFEDGVSKFGSELLNVKKHVKSVPYYTINRFYYLWKKTDRGKQVWGNFSGRKGKKEAKKAEAASKVTDDVADDHDDSAFDNDKALSKKRQFECLFCHTRSSRQWRRAPNTPVGTLITSDTSKVAKDKSPQVLAALCRRCAELWRRYAIQWEDIEEVAKKVAQGGGKAWKRRIDEELLKELQAANDIIHLPPARPEPSASIAGTPAPTAPVVPSPQEPPKKRLKGSHHAEKEGTPFDTGVVAPNRKKTEKADKAEKIDKPVTPAPPPEPEIPKPRILPCAVCHQLDPLEDQHLTCKECRMAVHRNCYGVVGEVRGKWTCDMCANDKNPQVSISYKCMLCPIEATEHDFVDLPKTTSRKKVDKERDRIERENAQKSADYYRKKQEEMNRPVNPREPLKHTANNNWVHVTCAIWTPEVKFGLARALQPSEGIPMIASERHDDICQACNTNKGACVSCHVCNASVHVECAHQNGYLLGFEITPVKGSRRDQTNVVNINGEAKIMSALIWCKDHIPTKTVVYRMHDIIDDSGLNALQLYAQNFKQADLTLTGTVRKATLVNQSTKATSTALGNAQRRASTNVVTVNGHRNSIKADDLDENSASRASSEKENSRSCITCGVDASPKWWPYPPKSSVFSMRSDSSAVPSPSPVGDTRMNGTHESMEVSTPLGTTAANGKTDEASTDVQCHKCHWRRKLLREPSPPPLPRAVPLEPPRPILTPLAPIVSVGPPPVLSPPSVASLPREREPSTTYWAPNGYQPGSPYKDWQSRPSSSLQNPPPSRMSLQDLVSPRPLEPLQPHSSSSQPPLRQNSAELVRSPLQNGVVNRPPPLSNPYVASPASQHHTLGSIHNGTYGSYHSPHAPHSILNGAPPPRTPESPYASANGHHGPPPPLSHTRPYGGLHGSPPPPLPLSRGEVMSPGRDHGPLSAHSQHSQHSQHSSLGNGVPVRPSTADNRVNGGASANPSLRNLIH